MRSKIVILASLLLGFSAHSMAASFDCAKAMTKTEKAICADATLSLLDETLSNNYMMILSANIGSGARSAIKAEQRAWLSSRNRCNDRQCLVNSYVERIDSVCEVPVLSGVHPTCTESGDVLIRP